MESVGCGLYTNIKDLCKIDNDLLSMNYDVKLKKEREALGQTVIIHCINIWSSTGITTIVIYTAEEGNISCNIPQSIL